VKSNKSILIVGHGLAGTILAHHLHQENIEFQIWNSSPTHFTSSNAAGGIFNPVTGRKLERTWLAKEIFTYLFSFYPALEIKLNDSFFFPMPLFRPFANAEMAKWLLDRRVEIDNEFLDWKSDGVWVNNAGWVDVPHLLQASQLFFKELGVFFEKEFVTGQSDSSNFTHVIFCEGFHGMKNPLWSCLDFLPAKGELLKIQTIQADPSFILNKNGFLLPIGRNAYKVGATYRWDEFGPESTVSGYEELEDKLAQFKVHEYIEIEKMVGIRPATQDRRPFVGMHPEKPFGIFNGFGSKGVSLIPYFANEFIGELQGKKMVHPDASIRRFNHLFSI
jgi:glycine/D-amino acid oxidase-like deaminating enzyme